MLDLSIILIAEFRCLFMKKAVCIAAIGLIMLITNVANSQINFNGRLQQSDSTDVKNHPVVGVYLTLPFEGVGLFYLDRTSTFVKRYSLNYIGEIVDELGRKPFEMTDSTMFFRNRTETYHQIDLRAGLVKEFRLFSYGLDAFFGYRYEYALVQDYFNIYTVDSQSTAITYMNNSGSFVSEQNEALVHNTYLWQNKTEFLFAGVSPTVSLRYEGGRVFGGTQMAGDLTYFFSISSQEDDPMNLLSEVEGDSWEFQPRLRLYFGYKI